MRWTEVLFFKDKHQISLLGYISALPRRSWELCGSHHFKYINSLPQQLSLWHTSRHVGTAEQLCACVCVCVCVCEYIRVCVHVPGVLVHECATVNQQRRTHSETDNYTNTKLEANQFSSYTTTTTRN